ncbi:hypothetical protein [Halobellus rarus]|uniref:Uncharacterized protein n=1 Tax=Halobellus rarus TaxID=1126237 RepID=A0ABD6CLW3_9EURY|nr:hypothetical protein [Halobellus rarus]
MSTPASDRRERVTDDVVAAIPTSETSDDLGDSVGVGRTSDRIV